MNPLLVIMTQETLNPKKIAVIGAGPGGITTLYDFTRTLKNGTSLYDVKNVKQYEDRKETAFQVTVFERNPDIGGVWSSSSRGVSNRDPKLPDVSQTDWTKPENIFVPAKQPDEEKLSKATYENPIIVKRTEKLPEDKYQWHSSAAYKGLFTNVPNRYMSFSFKEEKPEKVQNGHVSLFEPAEKVHAYLKEVVEENDLARYIRLNSNVEKAIKLDNGKWKLLIRESKFTDGGIIDRWYQGIYDALVIANGKTIPYVPEFKNFREFVSKNKDKVTVSLAKGLKDPTFLQKAKKVLFIGSSVSCVDLIQYAFPRDLEKSPIYISRKSDGSSGVQWLDFCTHSKGFINKPEVEEFLPDKRGVLFKDGTVVSDLDAVIITTGYHSYFPFLADEIKQNPDLTNFYLYTFSIGDPTLALIGNTYALFYFNRAEQQGAALAGVWSGSKTLPSKEEQIKWYDEKASQTMRFFQVVDRFIKPLQPYLLPGRPGVFDSKTKENHIEEIMHGWFELEDTFFGIKTAKYNITDFA